MRFYVIKNIVTGEMFSARRAAASDTAKDPNSPFLYGTKSGAERALKSRRFVNRATKVVDRSNYMILPVDLNAVSLEFGKAA